VTKFIKRIISYFGETYRLSPMIFYAELIELVLLVGASIVLTVTVLDPATQWFIPLYLVGSIFGLTSAILRRAGFVILLCGWFTMMNTISLVRLVMDAM
jgi:hypothetical protein